jgi:hypothetical protein
MWVLILFAHASILSDGDSMALTNVPGFFSQQECIAAGNESVKMSSGTTKAIKFKCFKVLK